MIWDYQTCIEIERKGHDSEINLGDFNLFCDQKAVLSPRPLLGSPRSSGEKMQEGRKAQRMGKQPSCRYQPDSS